MAAAGGWLTEVSGRGLGRLLEITSTPTTQSRLITLTFLKLVLFISREDHKVEHHTSVGKARINRSPLVREHGAERRAQLPPSVVSDSAPTSSSSLGTCLQCPTDTGHDTSASTGAALAVPRLDSNRWSPPDGCAPCR